MRVCRMNACVRAYESVAWFFETNIAYQKSHVSQSDSSPLQLHPKIVNFAQSESYKRQGISRLQSCRLRHPDDLVYKSPVVAEAQLAGVKEAENPNFSIKVVQCSKLDRKPTSGCCGVASPPGIYLHRKMTKRGSRSGNSAKRAIGDRAKDSPST